MLKKFCPRCGKGTDALFDALCEKCYMDTKEIISVPQNIDVIMCKRCGKSIDRNKWAPNESIDSMIVRAVNASIRPDKDTLVKVDYKPFVLGGKTTVPVTIAAEKTVSDKNIKTSVQANVVILPQVCDSCSRLSGSYYEAIIQIRGSEEKQEELLELVKAKVNQYKDSNQYSFITKTVKMKCGTDVYIGSSKAAQKIEQEAKKAYNVSTKITASIHGMKDGKEIIRLTVLLRACD